MTTNFKYKIGDRVIARMDGYTTKYKGIITKINDVGPHPYVVKHLNVPIGRADSNYYKESELSHLFNPNDILKEIL